MICATEGCENEIRPRPPGQHGRPRKYCTICKPPFQESTERIANRERIQELAAEQFRPGMPICECGRPIVVVRAYECSLCAARAKRAGSSKTKHLSV